MNIDQNITQVSVANLTTHPQNPRLGNVEAIKTSIAAHGFVGALIVQRDSGHIIAGNHRYKAAVALGYQTVPVQYVDCTDDEARRLLLADNKASDGADYSPVNLAALLADLNTTDLGAASGTLFSEAEIDAILSAAARAEQSPPGDNHLDGFSLPPRPAVATLAAAATSDEQDPFDDDDSDDDTGDDLAKTRRDSLDADTYTTKIKIPIYEPRGEKPAISSLFDDSKTRQIITEIEAENLPADVAAFLILAAQRHTIFHFRRIAEFYAHSDEVTQRLFERSALVIIDFNKAIEYGFVRMTERLGKLADQEALNKDTQEDDSIED